MAKVKDRNSDDKNQKQKVNIPSYMKNGKREVYKVSDLYPDQKEIVGTVMKTLQEWLECKNMEEFEPLRMIINGSGGCGKSVVINTIVACMRRMFDCDDVVSVAAPTGTAAFNVGGETIHGLLHMGIDARHYVAHSMGKEARARLVKKFRTLLALIIDERSLVCSKDLGTAEQMINETIFKGGHIDSLSWGGLPIVILVGDDYQLPGVQEGALSVLTSSNGGKMTVKGRAVLLECAEFVTELTTSRRLSDHKIKDKELMTRLRTGEVIDSDVQKLLSLHLEKIEEIHGKEMKEEIKRGAIFLFFRNARRIRHNLEMISKVHTSTNPVAIIRTQSVKTNAGGGKVNSKHFSGEPVPAAIICVEARVALEQYNFCPSWGLHNGACGTVEEIVFGKKKSPNTGHQPEYVVVNFPLYCGPVWDENNPTVSQNTPKRKRKKTRTHNKLYSATVYCHFLTLPSYATACPNSRGGTYLQDRMLQTDLPTPDPCIRKDDSQISRAICRTS